MHSTVGYISSFTMSSNGSVNCSTLSVHVQCALNKCRPSTGASFVRQCSRVVSQFCDFGVRQKSQIVRHSHDSVVGHFPLIVSQLGDCGVRQFTSIA